MKRTRIFSLLLAGALIVSTGTSAWASTEDEIAYAREQKQQAEIGLADTEAAISSLEGRKQELESYLAKLDAQYQELTDSLEELDTEAKAKEKELKQVKKELKKARKTAQRQYEAMKLRIVYMYENGGSTMLERLLSSKSIADFLNEAENVSQLSQYDRDMLKKYEEIRKNVKQQELQVTEEANAIKALQEEKAVKQQEVRAMAESTSADITTYVNELSATRAEAGALMAQISQADSNISALLAQAEAEKAAAAAAAEAKAASAEIEAEATSENREEPQGMAEYDPETDTAESSSSSTSSEIIVEEEDEEESEEENISSSGEGTYLGNFRLTGYCNCAQCCGTAGNATASGAMPTSGHTVAMAGVPFGTQLSINGTIYTVEDLGTPYGHVDIYFDSHDAALNFGSQYADVYQVN